MFHYHFAAFAGQKRMAASLLRCLRSSCSAVGGTLVPLRTRQAPWLPWPCLCPRGPLRSWVPTSHYPFLLGGIRSEYRESSGHRAIRGSRTKPAGPSRGGSVVRCRPRNPEPKPASFLGREGGDPTWIMRARDLSSLRGRGRRDKTLGTPRGKGRGSGAGGTNPTGRHAWEEAVELNKDCAPRRPRDSRE